MKIWGREGSLVMTCYFTKYGEASITICTGSSSFMKIWSMKVAQSSLEVSLWKGNVEVGGIPPLGMLLLCVCV